MKRCNIVGCNIVEGGGAHYGDDLWTCLTCGHQKYPEVFVCPRVVLVTLALFGAALVGVVAAILEYVG